MMTVVMVPEVDVAIFIIAYFMHIFDILKNQMSSHILRLKILKSPTKVNKKNQLPLHIVCAKVLRSVRNRRYVSFIWKQDLRIYSDNNSKVNSSTKKYDIWWLWSWKIDDLTLTPGQKTPRQHWQWRLPTLVLFISLILFYIFFFNWLAFIFYNFARLSCGNTILKIDDFVIQSS